jgi:hypothetical protein
MPSLPKEQCPVCRRQVPVRVNGDLREHTVAAGGKRCPGSGSTPAEATSLLSTATGK